jgi:negative regulator of flagellin synthesis FlgM
LKIDQNVISLKHAPATTQGPGRVQSAADPAPAGPAAARVSTALHTAGNGEFDAARVAEIRDAIAAGRYSVNTGRIADGLLDSVRDFLETKK